MFLAEKMVTITSGELMNKAKFGTIVALLINSN